MKTIWKFPTADETHFVQSIWWMMIFYVTRRRSSSTLRWRNRWMKERCCDKIPSWDDAGGSSSSCRNNRFFLRNPQKRKRCSWSWLGQWRWREEGDPRPNPIATDTGTGAVEVSARSGLAATAETTRGSFNMFNCSNWLFTTGLLSLQCRVRSCSRYLSKERPEVDALSRGKCLTFLLAFWMVFFLRLWECRVELMGYCFFVSCWSSCNDSNKVKHFKIKYINPPHFITAPHSELRKRSAKAARHRVRQLNMENSSW